MTKLSLIKSGVGAAFIEKRLFESDQSGLLSQINKNECAILNSVVFLKRRENDPLIKLIIETIRKVWNNEL